MVSSLSSQSSQALLPSPSVSSALSVTSSQSLSMKSPQISSRSGACCALLSLQSSQTLLPSPSASTPGLMKELVSSQSSPPAQLSSM